MAPFLSKPERLVPIPAVANQSRHSGGSYKLGWEAWSQQPHKAVCSGCLRQPLIHRPRGREGRQVASLPGAWTRPVREGEPQPHTRFQMANGDGQVPT